MAKRAKDHEFILKFIDLYRQLPELWNVNCPEYKDRSKKKEAYSKLIEKYKEFNADANIDTVKNKINILRTNYRKEQKKMEDSVKSGAAEVYKPTLWYFNEFSFLQDQESVNASLDAVLPEKDAEDKNMEIKQEEFDIELLTPPPVTNLLQEQSQVDDRNETSGNLIQQEDDSEYLTIAKYWAQELKKMNSEQQIFAKRAINEILIEGQLKTLHIN